MAKSDSFSPADWQAIAHAAYRAWIGNRGGRDAKGHRFTDWERLPPGERNAWEAAARAVTLVADHGELIEEDWDRWQSPYFVLGGG